MSAIWTASGLFNSVPYQSEADLEKSILQVESALFGSNRLYLDVKKRIGGKQGPRNIPDGYLLDLSGSKPKLFVVENELTSHDPLKHIAVQILEFSLSFEAEPLKVKRILLNALNEAPVGRRRCESYARDNGYRNLDHLLEYLVFEAPFSALVILDEIPDNLENILAKKFAFGVEVLSLRRYQDAGGNQMYAFEPFLADVSSDVTAAKSSAFTKDKIDTSDVDTVVVPARKDGFEEVFIGENCWYKIRLHGSMRPQIKYIAAYQVAPVSAITHLAPVKSIEPWKDSGKYVVNFADPAKPIGPIALAKNGRVKALQNLRYTTRERLENAKTLDDVW